MKRILVPLAAVCMLAPIAITPAAEGQGADFSVVPPKLGKDQVHLKLPAAADFVVVGGGGRFLLLGFRSLHAVGVFDVNSGKVIKFLRQSTDHFFVAAGANQLVVLLPETNEVERWSLRTLERDLTAKLDPADEGADFVVMGSASAGPVLVATPKDAVFYDLETLKKINIQIVNYGAPYANNTRTWGDLGAEPTPGRLNRIDIQSSCDGTKFTAWGPMLLPHCIRTLTLEGNTATWGYKMGGSGIPSGDGTLVFSGQEGFSWDFQPKLIGGTYFPSTDSNFFLAFDLLSGPKGVTIYSAWNREPVCMVSDLGLGARSPVPNQFEGMSIDKRVFLVPAANLIVSMTSDRDELILQKYDITAEMQRRNKDFLFVSSFPLRAARVGELYRYPIDVKSNKKGVKYRLASGPTGMQVAATGEVTWKVDAERGKVVPVAIEIQDASGTTITHRYSVAIR